MPSAKSTIIKLFPKQTINKNQKAIKAFKVYKDISDILDRAYLASGKIQNFRTNIGSTLKAEVSSYGISSTQKI